MYRENYKRACDIPKQEIKPNVVISEEKKITAERIAAAQAYAFLLRKNHPRMKPKKVQQLVCKKFKIKLT